MKVYTRRGDGGETDLFGGARVAKDHLRVEAYGAVDETERRARHRGGGERATPTCARSPRELQSRLFDLGAVLATPDPERHAKAQLPGPSAEDVDALEARIDAFEGELTPLRRFVLPGGHPPPRPSTWRARSAAAPSAAPSRSRAPSPSTRS